MLRNSKLPMSDEVFATQRHFPVTLHEPAKIPGSSGQTFLNSLTTACSEPFASP